MLAHIFDAFTDDFTSSIVHFLETPLCMIASDFNRCDTAFLSLLNLSNIVNFFTRNNAFLDKIFVDPPKHFNVYLRASLGSSSHCVLTLWPKIYGLLGHISPTKDPARVRRQNWDNIAIISLQHKLNSTDIDNFCNSDLSLHVETLSSCFDLILDICCPLETDCFSSPNLKQLIRKKKHTSDVTKRMWRNYPSR